MNSGASMGRRHTRQAGFSMVELLMTAFILAVGILGLTMLQAMSMRGSAGSKNLNSAVMLGEGILESIQLEGRQRMLFLKYAGSAPTTTYFGTGDIPLQYYAFDGTKLTDATNSFYTVEIKSVDIAGHTSTAGGTRQFTLHIVFTDTVGSATTTRQVTLTRQVAYA